MAKTIKYVGNVDRWPELPVTGGQSQWRAGQQEQRQDSEAEMLLLTGLFTLVRETSQYPMHITPDAKRVVTLQEGQALTVSGTAGTAGTVQRLDATGAVVQTWNVTSGALPPIGAYAGTQRFLITCTAGSIDATVGDAAVTAPQVQTDSAGRPVAMYAAGVKIDVPLSANVLLAKWRVALARVQAGNGNAVLLMPGDSTYGSSGSGAVGYAAADGRNKSIPVFVSNALNARGIPANANGIIGCGNVGTWPAFDTRFVTSLMNASVALSNAIGNTWSQQAGQMGTIGWIPRSKINRAQVYYARSASQGTFTMDIDGGATTASAAVGANAMVSTTINAASVDIHTFNVKMTASTGNFFFGFRAWDSTKSEVEVIQASHSGAGVLLFADESQPWSALNQIKALSPDLMIPNMLINGWTAAIPMDDFKAAYRKVIQAGLISGSVAIITGFPSRASSYPIATQMQYVDAAIAIANELGAFVIDTYRRMGSWDEGNALGFYRDELHLTELGSADQAGFIVRSIAQA